MEDRQTINTTPSPQAIRRALRRQRRAQSAASFDRSVPSALALPEAPLERTALVHQGGMLSPYIVRLSAQGNEERESLASRLQVNLLICERHTLPLPPETLPPSPDDLELLAADIASQIAEDMDEPTLVIRAKPLLRERMTPPPVFRLTEPLPTASIAPPPPPQDLLSRLELPEPEELIPEEETGSEADLVDLEILSEPAANPFAPPPNRPQIIWRLPERWGRALAVFVLLSFAFVVPLHAMRFVSQSQQAGTSARNAGLSGLSALSAAGEAAKRLDAQTAARSFGAAEDRFALAESSVSEIEKGVASVIAVLPSKEIRSGKALLSAAESLSTAGRRLSEAFVAMEKAINPKPTTRLALLRTYVEAALPDLLAAQASLERVDFLVIPEENRVTFEATASRLPVLIGTLQEFLEFEHMLSLILGANGTMRYLTIFQNNNEARATGGFMGSFAELHLSHGEVAKLSVPGGGTYDLRGSLERFVRAPEPVQLINARWEFQDANWFPDFPTSARKILEFYSDANQGTFDGVIAINATWVEDLLTVLGPVEMPKYGRTITAENFLFETQKAVELDYDKEENRPKAFLGELAPILLERALSANGDTFLSILDRLREGLCEKDLQIYFSNNTLEHDVISLGWGGELKPTDGDYLLVVNSNLGGGKTDLSIREDVTVDVKVDEDGSIMNRVAVNRTHFGQKGELFSGVNNVDYLRLYVPEGSELISAAGMSIPDASLFEKPEEDWQTDPELSYAAQTHKRDPASGTDIYEEAGKTVFGNWIQTKPGETSTLTFTYRLPITLETEPRTGLWESTKSFFGFSKAESYRLILQKQSGVTDRVTHVRLHVPDHLRLLWSTHEIEDAVFSNMTDGFFAALFEPNV